jgi:hypothetical protein
MQDNHNKLRVKLFLKRYGHLINREAYRIEIEGRHIHIPSVLPIDNILAEDYIRDILEQSIKKCYRIIEEEKNPIPIKFIL